MEEDRALEQLSKVLVRVNAQQAVRDESARLLADEMEYFEKKHRDDFSIDFFKMYDRYLERLQMEDRNASEKLEEIRPELEAARGKVLEASRRKKVVEQLKARQKERYTEDMRRAERKELEQYNLLRSEQPLTQTLYETFRTEPGPETTVAPPDEGDEGTDIHDREREQVEDDLIGQYYRNLGLPDPRKQ